MNPLTCLKRDTADKNTLGELLDSFEQMAKLPVPGVPPEQESVLFETGVFAFTGEPLYYVTLLRQFPNEDDEFFQLHLELHYPPTEENQHLQELVWSDRLQESIFDYIKRSDVYALLKDTAAQRVSVYMDET